VPLTDAGKEAAGNGIWPPTMPPGCSGKAFGVGGLVRQPGRIRIAWQDGNTLRLESDALGSSSASSIS
jgi:hypothetical protein